MHVLIHAAQVSHRGKSAREQKQPRVSARGMAPFRRNKPLRPIGAIWVHGKITATRTVCLLARRRLENSSAKSCRSGS
jgi:hypothetical protein